MKTAQLNHLHTSRNEFMVKLMVARGGIGLLLGLVLGPPFLNGGSVLGEVVDAVFGLANLVVRGTL